MDNQADQHNTMNDESLIRVTAAELHTLHDVTDWDRVDALADAEIEEAISEDPDAAPILNDEFWRRAKPFDPSRSRAAKRRDG